MQHKLFLHFFCWFALSCVVWVDDVYAYLDPASGSLIFQAVVAAIAGGAFLARVYWGKLKKNFLTDRVKQNITPKD